MKEFEDKIQVLESEKFGNAVFEICTIEDLEGVTNPNMAMQLYFAKQQGLKIRFVRIKLNDEKIKTEAGALYYYKGNIEANSEIGGLGGFVKKSISGKLTGESILKPTYKGCGDIYLEPSFMHYIMLPLENNSIIVDKSMFYCCSDSINIRPIVQKNVSSALLGNEGLIQMELYGTGMVILESVVPENELQKINLNPGEELKVDGNFAVLRSSNVVFNVTTSEKSLIASSMNGEGLLNTYRAKTPGTVWLAPTAPIYKKLYGAGMLSNANRNNLS